jgi:putative Mg2+ transporter-C (MgtC) family protein
MICNFEQMINVDFIIRVSAAVAFGFCVGLERELTNKYAGLRTHIMVALGACIFTLISIYGFPTFAQGDNVVVSQATGVRDTARVAAQVVTGIGFIGAGTVLRNGPIVLGLTTASTLWIAASIGMACGAGMFDIAFAGTALAILTLVMIRIFEKNVLPSSTKNTKMIKISLVCAKDYAPKVQEFITERYQDISEVTKRFMKADGNSVKLTCIISINDRKPIKDLYKSFQNLQDIESISIQEFTEK